MTNTERLVQTALDEVGYLEKASNAQLDNKTANAGYNNYTKYGAWYGMNAQAWCAMFVSWCFNKAGLQDIAPRYSWCYAGRDWFTSRGLFHLKDSGYIPQPGDVVFFSNSTYPNGGAHTGIVTGCSGGIVYTVEGNTSSAARLVANGGEVAEKAYTLSYTPIYGYGTPLWPVEEPEIIPVVLSGKEDYMTKAEILKELGDQWIERFDDLPDWAKPTMREILDKQFINGGTDYAVDPDDINMFLSDIKTIIVNKRMIDEAR